MEIMKMPVPEMPLGGKGGLRELEKWKNVSLVMVSARVPATGARRGDKIDCQVAGMNGKSIAGGRLAFAALQGPNVLDTRVFALCEGAIHLPDVDSPLVGVVHGGCQMEEDVFTPYVHNGAITLVLQEHHANFQTATEVVDSIHKLYSREGEGFVQALNASNIVVRIPGEYRENPVAFVADVLDVDIYSGRARGPRGDQPTYRQHRYQRRRFDRRRHRVAPQRGDRSRRAAAVRDDRHRPIRLRQARRPGRGAQLDQGP